MERGSMTSAQSPWLRLCDSSAGSIKGDVKRKDISPIRREGKVVDIQPLGCGGEGRIDERIGWRKGLQEILLIGLGDVVRSVRFSSRAVAKVPTMVLSETRGLRLNWVIRGGIRWRMRLDA